MTEPLTEMQVLGFEIRALGARMDAGFAQVDSRFAQVDSHFAQVDAQFAKVDALVASTTGAITDLRRDLSQRIDAVDRKVETVIDALADFCNEYQQHTHE